MFSHSEQINKSETPLVNSPYLQAVNAYIIDPKKGALHVALLEINKESAVIGVREEESGVLEQGVTAKLNFQVTGTTISVFIDSEVKAVTPWKNIQKIHFHFVDPITWAEGFDPYFWNFLNRREGFRVKPEVNAPIFILLEWEDESHKGKLIDISISGIGLEADEATSEKIEERDETLLVFRLPHCEMGLKITGKIRYKLSRTSNGKKIFRYGIKFDWSQTDCHYQQESAIANYVMERQRSMLTEQR